MTLLTLAVRVFCAGVILAVLGLVAGELIAVVRRQLAARQLRRWVAENPPAPAPSNVRVR